MIAQRRRSERDPATALLGRTEVRQSTVRRLLSDLGPKVGLAPTYMFLALALASPAQAQNAATGREMAEALCAKCHMNEGQGEKHGPMGIPSFSAVANRAGQTEQDVVRWLKTIPPMMPNHHLTQDEMFSLAAFIMTLRAAK